MCMHAYVRACVHTYLQTCELACVHAYVRDMYVHTVWPEILAGNLFWQIGGFEINPPIFHPPKTLQCDVIIIAKSWFLRVLYSLQLDALV